jgi:small GTP-binding protein
LIKLQIWDTAGQERFQGVVKNYFRNANGGILIFDVTNRESFENIHLWMEQIRSISNKSVYLMLVGNKIDLNNRKVSTEEAKKLAKTYSIEYMETSAKSNINVKETFEEISLNLYKIYGLNKNDSNLNLKNDYNKSGSGSNCC